MQAQNPITNLRGWIAHRLVTNYWFLALCAGLSAPALFAFSLYIDRNGGTMWLLDNGLAPVATADTASELAGVIAGIDAAFITLYFSISLIVLTIAAGNLGVRLIDRWLGKRLVRVSIAGLSFTLIFAVFTLAAIDADAPLAQTPLGTLLLTIFFLLVNIVMLAVALHDLGRTMFVDKVIDALANDADRVPLQVTGQERFKGRFAQTITAPRNGYVEGVDLTRIEKRLSAHPGVVRICVAPGQHVLKDQPLAMLENATVSRNDILSSIPIGPFRSDSQGPVFQIRLLVEIAARALSPGINDFYTAMAAADALVEVMASHCDNWVENGHVPVSATAPRLELPGQDFRGLFEDPLAAFRQAAANYPSVSIRMIGNIERILHLRSAAGDRTGFGEFLRGYAEGLHEHAMVHAELNSDRTALTRALSKLKEPSV